MQDPSLSNSAAPTLKGRVRSPLRYVAGLSKPTREAILIALARRDFAWVTAWFARLMMRRVYVSPHAHAGATSPSQPRRRVLLLPRAGLNDDVLNSLKNVGSIEVVTLPRRVLKSIATAFLPAEVDDNNYASASPNAQAAMSKYRAFLMRFWQALDPRGRIDAVISGNFGYYAEREFAAALEALGVPFVAMHKENSWSPGGRAFWERIYREGRGRFCGRRILVYSPIERDLQLDAGVTDPDRIEVVGMPRLDAVHRWRAANLGLIPKPAVLFASFPADVSMPVLRRAPWARSVNGRERLIESIEEMRLNLDGLCHSAHRAVFDLAVTCPDITVLVKTKGRARDRQALAELFGVCDERELPDNMRVVHGGSPLPLLIQAAVVGGFHSTLLLEALAAGRPVVVPWFGEVLHPAVGQYVFDLGPAVVRAGSPEDFTERLKEFALARTAVPETLPPATLSVLRDWLGNEDGRAGERAAAAILRVIEANHSPDLGSPK
jgi:hypothetical protein